MKEVEGVLNAKNPKPPNPKPSPKDFVWPSQQDHDDKVARKIGASLQELLPAKGWKHTDLARELWGIGANGAVRNMGTARRYIVADHPIPNEETAGHIAELLGVSMARLLEPEGNFSAHPEMIRTRSPNGTNLWKDKAVRRAKAKAKAKKGTVKKAKSEAKSTKNRDKEKQREYNAAYRARQKAAEKKGKRKYTRRAALNGHEAPKDGAWILGDGVDPPSYTISSEDCPPGHVKFELSGILPHERAMAILHMLKHEEGQEG